MNIVLEGPDNSGKSTLARYLNARTGRPIILSEGPEKHPGEINERIRRYEGFRGVIFDRHPVVSQPIYGRFRSNTEVDRELVLRFYDSRPLFIYCRGRSLEGHVEKSHDTSEHMALVNLNHDAMCRHYDEWAKDHAHIWYRVGDSMERIVNLVLGAIRED